MRVVQWLKPILEKLPSGSALFLSLILLGAFVGLPCTVWCALDQTHRATAVWPACVGGALIVVGLSFELGAAWHHRRATASKALTEQQARNETEQRAAQAGARQAARAEAYADAKRLHDTFRKSVPPYEVFHLVERGIKAPTGSTDDRALWYLARMDAGQVRLLLACMAEGEGVKFGWGWHPGAVVEALCVGGFLLNLTPDSDPAEFAVSSAARRLVQAQPHLVEAAKARYVYKRTEA